MLEYYTKEDRIEDNELQLARIARNLADEMKTKILCNEFRQTFGWVILVPMILQQSLLNMSLSKTNHTPIELHLHNVGTGCVNIVLHG